MSELAKFAALPGWKRFFLSPYLGQVSDLVGIQQQLLQTPRVAIDLVGNIEQGAVALIDRLNVTVAPPQGNAVKHHDGGGDEAAINKRERGGGGGCNRLPQDRPDPSSPPKTQAKQNSANGEKKKIEKHRNSARGEVVTE